MPIPLEEFYVPLLFVCILIGYQLSGYFFYQFFHFRKDRLYLNKILLAYGIFIFFGVLGVLFRILTIFFIKNSSLQEIFFKITNVFFMLSVFLFLLIISSKSFKDILNIYLTRIVCLIAIIPLFFLFFFDILSFTLNLIMMLNVIGLIYLFIFQIKLIKLSLGDVRSKLILLFIGEFSLGMAMLLGGEYSREFILKESNAIVLTILSPIIILALITVFFGIYNFPIFLEFKWKENLISIFIVNQLDSKLLYKFEFRDLSTKSNLKEYNNVNDKKKPILFSERIFKVEDIISTITKSNEKGINKIKQGNFTFLLKSGEEHFSQIIFCLLTDKEMNSHLYFLKVIINEFLKMYRSIIMNLEDIIGFEEHIFSSFDSILKNLIK